MIAHQKLLEAGSARICPAELARQECVSRSVVWHSMNLHGVKLARLPLSATGNHRDLVAEMRPLEAVEYLLNQIEVLVGADSTGQFWQWPGVHLTRQEKQLIHALGQAKGCIVSKAQLLAKIASLKLGDGPADIIVNVLICRVRAKIKASQVRIVNVRGEGYIAVVPDQFAWPWAE